MIVQRIQCYHYNEAFNIPFHSPQAKRLRADSVIVCMDCGPNGSGWGECAPRRYVTGEDAESVVALITQTFAPLMRCWSFQTVDDIAACVEALENHCHKNGIAAYHAALAAIDLGLLSALEQSSPTWGHALFPIEYRRELPFSASIPLLPLKVIEHYLPLVLAQVDVQIVKVLMGDASDDNYARVDLVRQLVGPATELRLEMNGKLALDVVHAELDRLMAFNPRAVEQPLPAGDIENLRDLRRIYDLAIVVDESLVRLEDARQLIDAGACDILNLKISKCGGLIKSGQIARMAARAGLNCQVGTHVGESELLGLAGRRFARRIPNFDCYGGGSAVLFSGIDKHGTPRKKTMLGRDPDPSAIGRRMAEIGRDLASRSRLCADVDLS